MDTAKAISWAGGISSVHKATDGLPVWVSSAYVRLLHDYVGVRAAEGDASSDVNVPYLDYKRD